MGSFPNVLGLAVSNINESQLQTYEAKTLFLMTSLQYYCIPDSLGLAEIKTYAQNMQDAQVTKSLLIDNQFKNLKMLFFGVATVCLIGRSFCIFCLCILSLFEAIFDLVQARNETNTFDWLKLAEMTQ